MKKLKERKLLFKVRGPEGEGGREREQRLSINYDCACGHRFQAASHAICLRKEFLPHLPAQGLPRL